MNSEIEVDADRATVVSDYLFVRRVGDALTPALAGRYRDTLERRDGCWCFTRREVRPWT
jgi:hypothetical protein